MEIYIRAGIIINDIKPSNIITKYGETGERELYLADLGIGQIRDKKFLRGSWALQGQLQVLQKHQYQIPENHAGTPLYIAPELLEGKLSPI